MLEFKKMEAVKFGDLVAQPIMNTERRMRLQNLDLSNGVDQVALDALASVFSENDRDEVKKFISDYMGAEDVIKLRAYLVGGEAGLERLEKASEMAIEQALAKRLDEVQANGQ